MLFDDLRKACVQAYEHGENLTLGIHDDLYVVTLRSDRLFAGRLVQPVEFFELSESAFLRHELHKAIPVPISNIYFQERAADAFP